ncbi:MAG: pitrilysin family protein [Steroidobacteraceae bacterium]
MTYSAYRLSPARTVILCLAGLANVAAFAAAPKAPVTSPKGLVAAQQVRSIEGVTEYRLANGLQVLLYPDQSSSTVSINVTYKVGSRHESYGETGMAHMLEHMNFKGTPTHPKIMDELSSRGAHANATTAYDRTNYFETLAASTANLEWALGMEADRMTHSLIAKKDLDSEMTVVRNEFEAGENNPARILRERVLETAYLWHNYGHPTIGARADIEGVPIERLQKFYHTYYQPDNAALIVTGKFDPKSTLAYIEKAFGVIPKPTRILPNIYTAEPPQDGMREVTLRRAGSEQVLDEAFHIPADAHPDSAPLSLLTSLLNEKPSGLLYKRLVETKLAVSASADLEAMYDPGFLMISVTLTKGGDLAAVRRELDAILQTVRSQDFSQDELERVRNDQFNGYEQLLNSSPAMASNLSENVAVGDWRLLFWDRDLLKKETVADVKRVANTYLIDSNLTVGMFIPDDKPLRAVITPASKVDALLAGYTGQAAVAEGEHFDATPKNLEARVKRGTAGSVKTAYLVKKTKGDRASGLIDLHFGSQESLKNKSEVGQFTAALLMRGTQAHTRQQIEDELTRLKTTLRINGGPSGLSASFETPEANLNETLMLVAEVLEKPAFPAGDLDELKREALSRIETARTDPQAIANLALRRALSPYSSEDFRYVPALDERVVAVNAVSIGDVESFYKEFYGASDAEAALVGSFDAAQASKELTGLFGGWKSPSPYERAVGIYKPTSSDSKVFATPDKPNAVYLAAGLLKIRDDDPQYPALEIGNEILGGGVLNSRLATRIRQKDGLSYGVGSQVHADSLDPLGSFSMFAISAPQNTAKVESDAREEVAKVLAQGFTAEEVSAAKSGILSAMALNRSNDAALARDLAGHLYLNRDFGWDAGFEKAIDTATPDAIHKAMQEFVVPEHFVTVKAGDFK